MVFLEKFRNRTIPKSYGVSYKLYWVYATDDGNGPPALLSERPIITYAPLTPESAREGERERSVS